MARVGDWYVSSMCPTHRTILQGEVYDTVGGLHLLYTTVKKPMRQALAEQSKTVKGPCTRLILQEYLNGRSYDWMMGLLATYPEHVIEFTALDCCWGTVPGHNTLFWEVRKGY